MLKLPINSTLGLKGSEPNSDVLSALIAKTEEHTQIIARLELAIRHEWQEKEILRNELKRFRFLERENENLRHDYEKIKSHLEEILLERDEKMRLQLDTIEERFQYLEAITLQITPRTCQTLSNLGVKRTGRYFIDPDGALLGDPPIKVLCDMDTVSTVVLHDSMKNDSEISNCAAPGCSARRVSYDASLKQMMALMNQSHSCHQGIKYDCSSAALSTGDVHYAWWMDRHGQPQYYWHGSNATKHTCKCGLSGDCVDLNLPCNCDSEAPQWESDSGEITNKTALPIAELRFGGLQFAGQKAKYTLGGLVCTGEAPQKENPATSCSSLRQAGNARTGYHLISRKNGRLDVVLCRMDLEETDLRSLRCVFSSPVGRLPQDPSGRWAKVDR
ncbi:unnamed protein product [Darwinula stevensoni]|uniref:Uncharacterized protein n=1 Tax=Darwinula stevensoni TaxID=69355 RepID=A0A7R9A730_9CRUS|nr:unnamed protein product [Darwinula stevensoni]CAG0891274.1 unnamed protein product [Darwinula stevensoni]